LDVTASGSLLDSLMVVTAYETAGLPDEEPTAKLARPSVMSVAVERLAKSVDTLVNEAPDVVPKMYFATTSA
jgi:hypothetical protein